MKPEEYFSNLASSLNLTESERKLISDKHLSLRERLKEMLPVEDDFLTGSYARNTIIRPTGDTKFDADFFWAFSNDDFGDFELPMLLETVKEALEEIRDYDSDIIGVSEQNRSIAVEYEGDFQIDVVPSIQVRRDELYKIFDKQTRQPVESNPKLHGSILTDANASTESGSVRRLVPIIKLLKSWKRDKCDYLKSFHMELLAVEILKDEPIASYSAGLSIFFGAAPSYLRAASLVDPANSENLIDAYIDEEGARQQVFDIVVLESENAKLAARLEAEGEDQAAVDAWSSIFESDNGGGGTGSGPAAGGPTIITRPPKQYYDVRSRTDQV